MELVSVILRVCGSVSFSTVAIIPKENFLFCNAKLETSISLSRLSSLRYVKMCIFLLYTSVRLHSCTDKTAIKLNQR